MWKLKSSSSPIAATGEANATSSSTSPSAKSATRQRGTGVPRRAQRPCARRVGDARERDRRELERVERPVRQEARRQPL